MPTRPNISTINVIILFQIIFKFWKRIKLKAGFFHDTVEYLFNTIISIFSWFKTA